MNPTPAGYAAYISTVILALVAYVTYKVLNEPFSPEVQSMVVASVVSGGLGAVAGFWLGSSASSQRKTEAEIAKKG